MRLRRFAAGTQPSLLLRRFFTNLHQWKHTGAFLSPRRSYAASITASGKSEMRFAFSGWFGAKDSRLRIGISRSVSAFTMEKIEMYMEKKYNAHKYEKIKNVKDI